MVEIIAGRLREAEGDTPISKKMAKLLFDGLAGKIVLSEVESTNRKGASRPSTGSS